MVTDRKQWRRQRLGATSTPDIGCTKRNGRICPNIFDSDKMKESLESGRLFRIVCFGGGLGEILSSAGREEKRGEEWNNKPQYVIIRLLQTLLQVFFRKCGFFCLFVCF